MKDDSTLNYDEMPMEVKKIFMLGMQLCIAMNEMSKTKKEMVKFVEECWVTMNMNDKGNLSDILNDQMMHDIKRFTDENEI